MGLDFVKRSLICVVAKPARVDTRRVIGIAQCVVAMSPLRKFACERAIVPYIYYSVHPTVIGKERYKGLGFGASKPHRISNVGRYGSL